MSFLKTKNKTIRSEFINRVISAIVLAVGAIYLTWIGGLPFALLCAIGAILLLHEFLRICATEIPSMIQMTTLAFLVLSIAAWLGGQITVGIMIAAIGVVVLAISQWISRRNIWASVGLAYAVLPFFATTMLRGKDESGLIVVLVLFACVWGADSLAYFSGRAIGGPKLAPTISPKKTWAGFVGGLLGALAISTGIAWWFGFHPDYKFALLIVFLAIVSQLGDLVESAFKRYFDVKDSGHLIPGHGGVLDRIDGLIAASVALFGVAAIVSSQQGLESDMPLSIVHVFLMP